MEALRLAFDTIIVGALALPWLCIIVWISFPDLRSKSGWQFPTELDKTTQAAVTSVLLVAIGYFVGSAMTRVADDFFDDEEIPYLPTEHNIRHQVYCDELKAKLIREDEWRWLWEGDKSAEGGLCPTEESGKAGKDKTKYTTEVFRLQESKILQLGTDKIERLQQLHEQIVVLRGTTLNGVIFSILCGFGFFTELQARLKERKRIAKLLPPVALILFGGYALYEHLEGLGLLKHFSWKGPLSKIYSEPPTMEGVVFILGVAGFRVLPLKEKPGLYGRAGLLGLFLAILAYLGWWLTEVLYNQYVIHAFYALGPSASGAAH